MPAQLPRDRVRRSHSSAGYRFDDASDLVNDEQRFAQVEQLWRASYPGPRDEGPAAAIGDWLRLKLKREAVSTQHSRLAWAADGQLAGYFLVGAREGNELAGIGLSVAPALRRRGIASELIARSIESMRGAPDVVRLVCDIESALHPHYRSWGFSRGAAYVHLLSPRPTASTATRPVASARIEAPGLVWAVDEGEGDALDDRLGWRMGNWRRTPGPRRASFSPLHFEQGIPERPHTGHAPSSFGLTLEGRTMLVHWYRGDALGSDLRTLARAVDRRATLLVYGVSSAHPQLEGLLRPPPDSLPNRRSEPHFRSLCPFERWVYSTS